MRHSGWRVRQLLTRHSRNSFTNCLLQNRNTRHTHSVAIGSHGHTITVNAAGNAENTVKNIAFNYIVRLA
ncbi:hypothetical protein EB651_16295 [Escherichia coli]|nr:hypothetical protein [Escherichia coli]